MQFDFAIPANGAQVLDVVGRFVKYTGGTGKIRVRMDKGGYIDLLPGQGAKGLDFSRLQIEDRSGSNNVGILLAGNFEFQDDRVSGDVSVIDGGKNRTLANLAFLLNCDAAAPGAGNYGFTQAFNPIASGKNMVVETMYLTSQTAATTFSIGIGMMQFETFSANGNSKKGGGADSLMQSRNSVAASTAPIAGGKQVLVVNTVANTALVVSLKEPIVIPPGYCLYFYNAVTNLDTRCTVEYYEDAI